MKLNYFLLMLLLTYTAISCSNNKSYNQDIVSSEINEDEAAVYTKKSYDQYDKPTSTTSYNENIPVATAKIIKTGNVKIKVDDYLESIKLTKQIINKYNASIISENENSYYYGITNFLQIKVKSNLFDSLLTALTKDNNVLSKEVSAQDVTEEYIDTESRIKSKKQVRDKYSEILSQARTIGDIVIVEDKLRVIQEEIEAKEGRLNYLKKQTNFSTINLTISQEDSNVYEPSFLSKIGKGFESGWDGLKWFFIIIIYLWPLWLIITGVLIWLKHYLKKRKAKKQQHK